MSNVKLQGNVSGTGSVTITSPNTNSDRTITLPDSSGTFVVDGASQSPTFNAVTTTTLSVAGNNISAVNSMGFRNRIINGDMRIDQRNAGASVTPTNSQYLVDRFYAGLTQASKYTAQQSSTAPAGFTKSLLITSSSAYSVGANDTFYVGQVIEGYNIADLGWGAAGAQTVTLSFWVRSSLTGTFGGTITNATARAYLFSYTISAANTWEQKTVTIAGDTSGTWGSTNAAGIIVWFGLGSGSTYSGTAGVWSSSVLVQPTGSTSVVGTNGATFYITGVQLEAGSVASPFERRDYGRELMMCQRYFHLLRSSLAGFSLESSSGLADRLNIFGSFPVAMRAAPTASITNPIIADLSGVHNRTQSSANVAVPSVSGNLIDWRTEVANFSSLTYSATYVCSVTSSGSIQFNAEL